MARTNRNQPLPTVAQPRVSDSTVQRAFDALFVPLREVLRFLQPFVQSEKWKPLPYLAGWSDLTSATNFQRGGFRKSPLGRVELRGVVTRFSGVTTTMAVLPVGYRPHNTCIFVAISNATLCRVDVDAGGLISVSGGGPGNYVSLDGMSFDTVSE